MQAINKVTGLTKKQEDFAQAYVRCGNATESYREAYNASKMKPESIHVYAHKLLKNPKVALRVKELQEKAANVAKEKFNIDSEEILRHLNILRNARIDEYVELTYEKVATDKYDEDGNPIYIDVPKTIFKPFDQLTPEQLMCIESIKQNRYGEVELKLHGKEWTIEKINKHIGFYEKDNKQKASEVTVNNTPAYDLSKLSENTLEELEKARIKTDNNEIPE